MPTLEEFLRFLEETYQQRGRLGRISQEEYNALVNVFSFAYYHAQGPEQAALAARALMVELTPSGKNLNQRLADIARLVENKKQVKAEQSAVLEKMHQLPEGFRGDKYEELEAEYQRMGRLLREFDVRIQALEWVNS